jgi:hypothetical protein
MGRRGSVICVLATVLATCIAGCDEWFGNGNGSGHELGGVGDACEAEEDCRDTLTCDEASASCQPEHDTPVDGYCELTADCEDGLYCSFARSCEQAGASDDGGACGTTADCEPGLICVLEGLGGLCRPAGAGDLGDPCTTASDCLAGLVCAVDLGGEGSCDSPSRSSDPEPPPMPPFWAGEECSDDAEAEPVAYFRVPRGDMADGDFYRLPYPNDIRRTAAGLDLSAHPHPETAVSADIIDLYLRSSEEDLDGFARNPVVFFRFSVPQDYDTIHEAITLVNVTAGSEEYGETLGYGWYATHHSGSKYICENWIGIMNTSGFPLRSGETYAVLLDTTVVPDDGGEYRRAADFEAMLADSAPSDPDLSAAYEAYAPLRQYLGDNAIDPATVLNAAVFTTQRSETVASRLREVVRSREPAVVSDLTLCDDGVTSPCDDGTEDRACGPANAAFHEVHGRLRLPIFQQGTAPYETPEDGGGIEVDDDGRPVVAQHEEVCFAMTIPRDVPVPEGGFPVLLYGHGTGGSFRNHILFGLAEDMATSEVDDAPLPVATVAIDLPEHGARRGGSDRGSDVLFFNFLNPRAARDNVMQGAADLLSLVYWAGSYEVGAGDSPTGEAFAFDPARIALLGHSQGATHAALMVPFEPDLVAVVLSGEGGHLIQSLLNKTEPYDIAGLLPFALLDPDENGALAGGPAHPALAMFQAYFERVDPVNFGGLLRPGSQGEATPLRHVFMTYGIGDSYAPEETQRAYARSAAFTLVEPILSRNRDGELDPFGLRTAPAPLSGNVTEGEAAFTYGLRQYEPDGDYDGHFVSSRHEQGRADVLRFLRQALAGQTPQIGG